tara:strand:- start:595 stop:873 length:279 start_codon:yes stop_codon:yes gene_type:complete
MFNRLDYPYYRLTPNNFVMIKKVTTNINADIINTDFNNISIETLTQYSEDLMSYDGLSILLEYYHMHHITRTVNKLDTYIHWKNSLNLNMFY